MIKLAFDNDFRQLNHLSVQESFEKIAAVYYPQLQIRLKLIGEIITQRTERNTAAEKAILLRINQEINSMKAKEQTLLLPLLIVLEKEGGKSDCAPFKLTKRHYHSLRSCFQTLTQLLIAGKTAYDTTQLIIEQVNDLEQEFVQLQRAKEKYLFNQFKNCDNSCKIQPYEQGE